MRKRLLGFAGDEGGASALELALVLFLLTIPILNVVDLAFYAFNWMQTQNAAQMGAQAAFSNCNTSASLPVSTECYGKQSANNMTVFDVVNQGIQESALTNTVTLTNSNIIDGFYCTTNASVLTQVGNLGFAFADTGVFNASPNNSNSAPSNTGTQCGSAFADSAAPIGEYVRVDVTHTYTSIFPGMTVAALLPPKMTATAYARVD